ncbi:mfd [Wigglesworthia glossinidia endosymbiont of Glossina brevipalpis]|uniref:Transcription-repair-coupling factor n=1 Tax=Wigglesworthia glossinidia brevipalpis TaxID=36870 RepID=Q8D3A2_WIGBR|nr:mfd [Wigglesworthia glossinidia endosymbiont of Glossina brevipalpis]
MNITKNIDVKNFSSDIEFISGDFIIHIDHGIGKYIGTKFIETSGIKNEYMVIQYAENDILYLPFTSLHLISKYKKNNYDSNLIILDKLGSDTWKKYSKKIIKKINDIAVEILDNASERLSKKGFSFELKFNKYKLFCNECNFDLTQDQNKAILEVIDDMKKSSVMNRLICGDVGFGKTEIAMRAAFIAIQNKKQVSLLTPTTLLSQQHFDNFKLRFKKWPIKISILSRFLNKKEQNKVIKMILIGEIDILIGTHRILQKDIIWKDLGLLIIDEEHRFGVSQKECIKTVRTGVDVLSLTATPIPRTLNMAMNGLRDLSIISTPPKYRLPVKTFIYEYNKDIIKKAIKNELSRKGQIYYLHNNISTINETSKILKKIAPKVRIKISHSKMCKNLLKKTMQDFKENKFDMLVCTSIIETGIDIANANTIIIEKANQFGLAQLNQLRGRVGRSFRQAYAYLFTSKSNSLNENSKKRLEAISSINKLGSGFSLSINDLEIRGSGELLGSKQSGKINSIGISLYNKLLKKSIKLIKSGKELSLETIKENFTEVNLNIPAFIPDSYIPDVSIRLFYYKKFFSETKSEINNLKNIITSKFGKLPKSVCYLIEIAYIRQKANFIGIKIININFKGGFVEFNKNNSINYESFIRLLKNYPKIYKIISQTKLRIKYLTKSHEEKIDYIKNFLNYIK